MLNRLWIQCYTNRTLSMLASQHNKLPQFHGIWSLVMCSLSKDRPCRHLMIVSVSCRPPFAGLDESFMSSHVHNVCSCSRNGVSMTIRRREPPSADATLSIVTRVHTSKSFTLLLAIWLSVISQKWCDRKDNWSVAKSWSAMPFKMEQARTLQCTTGYNTKTLVDRQVVRCFDNV